MNEKSSLLPGAEQFQAFLQNRFGEHITVERLPIPEELFRFVLCKIRLKGEYIGTYIANDRKGPGDDFRRCFSGTIPPGLSYERNGTRLERITLLYDDASYSPDEHSDEVTYRAVFSRKDNNRDIPFP